MRQNLAGSVALSLAICATTVSAAATLGQWWSLYFAIGALRALDEAVLDDEFVLAQPSWVATGRFVARVAAWLPSDALAVARDVTVVMNSGDLDEDPQDG